MLAEDTSLTRDLALANQDTASKPELRDVPVATQPDPVVAEPERAPPPAPRRVTKSTIKKPAPRVAPKAVPVEPVTPQVQVTATGNTERATEAGSERPLGVVSSGSEIALTAGQRICTNTTASVTDSRLKSRILSWAQMEL